MSEDYVPPKRRTSSSIGRWALIFVLFSIASMVLVKYFKSGFGLPSISDLTSFSTGDPDMTHIPEEMQITYIPSDYRSPVNEEDAMVILSNPQRYRRDFDQLIYTFNLSLLSHVANRMDLSRSVKANLETEYQKHHDYYKDLYYKDFIALRDTTDNNNQLWYQNESASAVETLNEVASKYTCSFVNVVIMGLLEAGSSAMTAKGNRIDTPCGIALQEGLGPTIKRLQERAAIEDFAKAKGLLEEKVEKAVAELATMEIRDRKGLSKSLKTKVWGMDVSTTDIEVSAMSILKVGFKLDEYFDLNLDDKRKIVTVTLPEPQILSHEVYPKVDKLEVGWMRELQDEDFNRNFNLLRTEFRKDAIDSDVMDKAKQEAANLMDLMFSPVISSFSKKYQLQVKFRRIIEERVEYSAVEG